MKKVALYLSDRNYYDTAPVMNSIINGIDKTRLMLMPEEEEEI
jgi:hypothetical protein